MDFSLKLKKGLASIASVAMLATALVVAPSAQAAWYTAYVDALVAADVVESDFDAAADTTRLGFVTALVKAAGVEASDNDAGFADVNDGYVNAAVEKNFIDAPKADKDMKFFPNDNISRAALTKVALEAMNIDVDQYSNPAAPHADVPADAWFADYVAAGYNLSIIDGVGGSTEEFNPAGNIKNAAMAKVVAYAIIVAEDEASFERFDDGTSAFSVFDADEVKEQVEAIVVEETPAEETPAEETPAEETPAEEAPEVSDGSLEVSTSADSPSATDIPGTVQGVKYLAVDFSANGDDIKVSNVTVERSGLGSRSDFDKVWLEIDGKRITSKKTVTSEDISNLTILNGGFEVDAGDTVTVDVVASMSATSGQINKFSIVSADSITSNGESVVGDFPIVGAEMKTTNYTVTKARIEAKGSAETVDVNDDQVTIGEFDIAVSSTSDKDAYVRELVLENEGTSDVEGVLENIKLYQSGAVVSQEVTVSGDVVRIFLGEEGFMIEDGDTKRFEIKADLVDGEEGKTFQFQVKEREDLVAIESGTGFATTNFEGGDFTTNSLADYNATAIYTINAGKITVSLDPSSPTNQDVARDASAVELLVGEIKVDQPIRVDGLKVYIHSDSVFDDNIGGTSGGPVDNVIDDEDIEATLENVKLYIGGKLIDTLDAVNDGTEAGDNAGLTGDLRKVNATSFYYDFDSTFDIEETSLFRVVADMKDAVITGSKIKLTVGASNFTTPEYVSTGDSVQGADISGTATSNVTTVIVSSATVTRNDGYSDGETFVAGAKNVKLGQFVVEAGSASNVEIRKLVFNFGRDNDNDGTLDGNLTTTDFANIKLMAGDAQLGDTDDLTSTTIDTQTAGTITFDSLNYTITKSGQATFSVYGDVESNATAITDLHVYMNGGSSIIEDSQDDTITITNNFDVTNVAKITLSAGGTLTVTADGDTPDTGLIVAKSTDVEVAKFKIVATDEIIEVTDLYFMNDYDNDNAAESDADSRFSALKLYVGSDLVDSRVPTAGTVHFELGNTNKISVPKDDDVVVTIKADLNNITSADQTNKQVLVSMYALEANSTGTGNPINTASVTGVSGSDATTTLTTNVDADVQYIVKTQPTITTQTLSTTKLVSGEQTLYKASIAADASEDVEVAALTFNVSGKLAGTTVATADSTNKALDSGTADVLTGFKLYVNGNEVTSSKYTLSVTEIGTTNNFAINFALGSGNEETISGGSSKVFELKATAASVQSDDYVSVKIVEDSSATNTATITIGGSALGAGEDPASANVVVNGTTFAFDAAAAATNDAMATALAALINADANYTSSATGSVVTITTDRKLLSEVDASALVTAVDAVDVSDNDTTAVVSTNNLMWSDNAGSPHSRTTADWFNGFEVKGLDTATTTLQN